QRRLGQFPARKRNTETPQRDFAIRYGAIDFETAPRFKVFSEAGHVSSRAIAARLIRSSPSRGGPDSSMAARRARSGQSPPIRAATYSFRSQFCPTRSFPKL